MVDLEALGKPLLMSAVLPATRTSLCDFLDKWEDGLPVQKINLYGKNKVFCTSAVGPFFHLQYKGYYILFVGLSLCTFLPLKQSTDSSPNNNPTQYRLSMFSVNSNNSNN